MLGLPAPFVPHSASLSTPVPVSAPPTSLDECLFFISLVWTSLTFDFLSVLAVQGVAVCLPTPPSCFSLKPRGFATYTDLPAIRIETQGPAHPRPCSRFLPQPGESLGPSGHTRLLKKAWFCWVFPLRAENGGGEQGLVKTLHFLPDFLLKKKTKNS